MQSRLIVIGEEYAVREPPRRGEPFQHVRALEKVRGGRWRVEWINPTPGLVDYLKPANFIVPWPERRAVERDERNYAKLAELGRRQWDGPDGPTTSAVQEVFEASGESLNIYNDGVLTCDPSALNRVRDRSGAEPADPLDAYTDRHGQIHLPFEYALDLARSFAAAEPTTVLTHVDLREREYNIKVREPGGAYILDLLNRWRVHWALVRQWASHDVAVAEREKEIQRLRELLHRTVWELRQPAPEVEAIAGQLDRALRGS